MVVAGGSGVPIGVHLASATPGEATLAEATLRTVRVPRPGPGRPKTNPPRVIADRAYDSLRLREALARRGIDLIAPHLRTRKHKVQDGRKLRRYRRRWIIERTNSWINTSYRRLTCRWDTSLTVFSGFLHIALMLICLRRL